MILTHPHIPTVTVDVADRDVKAWQEQGWVNPPKPRPKPVVDAVDGD